MILQALKEYYDRMAADPESGIAPLGWEWKSIDFVFVISEEGVLNRIERLDKKYCVPLAAGRSGKKFQASCLWDKADYLLPPQEKDSEDRKKQHALFLKQLDNFTSIDSVVAVKKFLTEYYDFKRLSQDDTWKAFSEKGNATFRLLTSNEPIVCDPKFKEAYDNLFWQTSKGVEARCLVTGTIDSIPLTHDKIANLGKDRGPLISFNEPAFESFGKKQNQNSPIGKRAALSYTNALNTLIGSKQKIRIGETTTVFWSEKKSMLEDEFADLFDEPEKDNPNKNTAKVAQLLSSVETGVYSPEANETRFYVLGLATNSGRVVVRFWHVGTVAEMETRFANWFKDLQIVHGPKEKEHLSLWRLLISTAMEGKTDKINPNLAGAVMRAILGGLPLPDTLRNAVLTRIKAERKVSYPRAKLLKAYLNRLTTERKFTVSLDLECQRIGYCLGRLFATLEKIQEEANPGLNATIRDRFYASASSAPVTVFANLVRLSNHHRGKLSNKRKIYFEKLLGEIIAKYDKFPAHLSLNEQAEFAIGYYHQRQDFFTTKNDDDNAETANNA